MKCAHKGICDTYVKTETFFERTTQTSLCICKQSDQVNVLKVSHIYFNMSILLYLINIL